MLFYILQIFSIITTGVDFEANIFISFLLIEGLQPGTIGWKAKLHLSMPNLLTYHEYTIWVLEDFKTKKFFLSFMSHCKLNCHQIFKIYNHLFMIIGKIRWSTYMIYDQNFTFVALLDKMSMLIVTFIIIKTFLYTNKIQCECTRHVKLVWDHQVFCNF